MANQAQGAPMGGGAQPSSVTSAAAAGGASARAQGAQHDARAAAQEKKAKAKKPKVGVFRWKGILGNSRPIVRKLMLLLIAVAIATLAFTQLGLTGLGVPGNYIAYGNVMLSAIVLAGLLFGIPWGTALGAFTGIMMAAHAAIQPLDYYEITFMASVPSIIMFTFVGFFGSLFLSLALRRNPGTVRRIVRIVIICLVIAFFYSVFFVTSAVFEIVKQLVNLYADAGEVISSGDLSGIVKLNMGLFGRLDVQFLFDAGLMILTCIVADAIVRKSRKTEGNHSMIVLFRAWLLGIVALVFMVSSVVSFVTITETAKATAKQDMDEEIAYLANQLDIFETRSGLMRDLTENGGISIEALSKEDSDTLSRAFSAEGLLQGYEKEGDGTVVIFYDNAVMLSDDPNYPVGESWEDFFGMDAAESLDQIAQSDELYQAAYDASHANDFESSDSLFANSDRHISTQAAYMRAQKADDYYIMILYPGTKVFAGRASVMLWTTLTVMALLIVIFLFASWLLNRIVVRHVDETNGVLAKITAGNLEERVDVRDTREFKSLSRGINTTVDALRGWIAEAETRMEAELNTAKAIQESALPRTFPPFPDIRRFDIYANMHAAREVGGDFYDFFLIGDDCDSDNGKLGFVVADVSGKGVPAALFMMTAKTLIRDYVSTGMDLGEAVENANRQLCEGNDAGMFVTAFVGILDYGTGHVTYVNAGHNPPLVWQKGGWRWITDKSGLPLGLFDGLPYDSYEMDCEIGDQFLLYSDGVTEAMDVDGKLYGEDRLKALLDRKYALHPRMLVGAVRYSVAGFAHGAVQSDDITILALEVGVPPEVTATLIVPADVAELPRVNDFVHTELDRRLCPLKAQNQLDIAIEELFVNVAHYAYPDATAENPGTVRVSYTYSAEPPSIEVEIADDGIPYDPLAKPDAATADSFDSIADVPIGGLGILMAKQSVDDMTYERLDNSNVVTIKKRW